MYVDSADQCNDLGFNIGGGASTITRAWTIKVFTLFFYWIEPLKNGPSLILPSSIARNSSAPNAKRIFQIL